MGERDPRYPISSFLFTHTQATEVKVFLPRFPVSLAYSKLVRTNLPHFNASCIGLEKALARNVNICVQVKASFVQCDQQIFNTRNPTDKVVL